MSRGDLRRELERAGVPDAEGAERRARAVVEGAFRAAPARRRRPRAARTPLVAALAVVLALATLTAALSPPGAAVAGWVKRTLGVESRPPARVALGPLPGGGRLLVSGAGGTWVVAGDGTRARLGSYAGATWSPRGLFVAAWRGRRLSAVAPDGRVAWSYRALGEVRAARWSPDGFRIAYLRDDALAVVAGDGTGARILQARVRPTVPAWRPGSGHVLAWVAGDGRVAVADADTGRVAWRSPASVGHVRALQWSADGRRILARRRGDVVRVLDVAADRAWRTRVPAGRRVVAAAWAPRGGRLALVTRIAGGVSTVTVARDSRRPLAGRRVFATTGRLGGLTWSPDGRRLLVAWGQADQWLLVPADGRGRIVAVGGLRRRFGAAPAVQGWCCPRR